MSITSGFLKDFLWTASSIAGSPLGGMRPAAFVAFFALAETVIDCTFAGGFMVFQDTNVFATFHTVLVVTVVAVADLDLNGTKNKEHV